MKVVLGMKLDPWHDTGAAVVVEDAGRLKVKTISQERLNRQKHTRAFPLEAAQYCLDEAGCRLQDVNLVVCDYIITPDTDDCFPGYPGTDQPRKKEFFRRLEELGIPYVFVGHHLCHMASAYFATDWPDATGLVIDGHGSSYETQSIFSCQGGAITPLAVSRQPGIGWLYTVATEVLLGFAHLQDGKTMGLAGWAKKGSGSWRAPFSPSQDVPSNPIETPYWQFVTKSSNGFWMQSAAQDFPRRPKDQDPTAEPYVQYAAAAQEELERVVMQLARFAHKICPRQRLCYAGGVGLNILANRLLVDSGLFQEIFIQPAASDAGIPLGAALLGYHTMLGGTQRWRMEHAFLSRQYPPADIEKALASSPAHRTAYSTATLSQVLNNDYLIAWYDGASEFGPRALGHRSILCCPRHPQMKAYLNAQVKHREMFRPFAPIIPIERQADFFDLQTPSPYMLINARVRQPFAAHMPAIVHADGTARVQAIEPGVQPRLHELLRAMEPLSGTPVLLNTSLNLAGEPIVETPADTVDLFQRSRLDALVMGDTLLTKKPLEELLCVKNPGLHGIRATLRQFRLLPT